MKSKIFVLALFVFTAASVVAYPLTVKTPTTPPVARHDPPQPGQGAARIDVVFALDTTGSMGGLIQAAKEKIWSIASSMAQADPAPVIRMGLVAYRDRGDQYVTRVYDLSSDLDSMYASLMDFQAGGGGDTPESVNQALNDAVSKISWSTDPKTYRVIFLVGDAPPHMNYQDDVKYPVSLAQARQKGIVVNAIQCGSNNATRRDWRRIAQLASGDYFQVAQTGSAVAIKTPFDRKLAKLSRELDATRIGYGSHAEQKAFARKQAATEKLHKEASAESQARRAAFNASASGKLNQIGEHDLVEDVSSGRVDLDKLDKAKLPAPVAAMAPAEQRAMIQAKAKKRQVLEEKISDLAKQRDTYIRQKMEDTGAAKGSLDDRLFGSVRKQAEKHGLTYKDDAPAY